MIGDQPQSVVIGQVVAKTAPREIKKMLNIKSFSAEELDMMKIIHSTMSNRTVLNTYRELRTKLLQKSKKQNCVIMVSSLLTGGGGSTVTTNLASVFALDKTKTSLLIDCNLYAPGLSQLLPEEPEYGLTDHLVEPEVRIEDTLHATGIERVRLIPIGSHIESAAEHFDSQKMQGFMGEIKDRYPDRYIFIDAPPILECAESRILAAVSDFVVLVVPYGRVTSGQVASAVEVVGEDKLAGFVFNN